MGLFDFMRKGKEEKRAFQEENLKRLEGEFDPTGALGAGTFPDAMQFIFDGDRRCFVVVEGSADDFRSKNPYVIDFDQVEDAYVEVDEYWTEKDGKFDLRAPGQGSLKMEDFDKVFWRYDVIMHFKTTHPYAKHVEYRMNRDTIITRVSGLRLISRRGLELNGQFRGEEIKRQSQRVAEFAAGQQEAVGREKVLGLVTGDRPDGLLGMLVQDFFEQAYVDGMNAVSEHLDRAYRICKVLEK